MNKGTEWELEIKDNEWKQKQDSPMMTIELRTINSISALDAQTNFKDSHIT